MEKHFTALANYVSAIEEAAYQTSLAGDYMKCQERLASAAVMFAVMMKNKSFNNLEEIVANERLALSWDCIGEASGAVAERLFDIFATLVENDSTRHSHGLNVS